MEKALRRQLGADAVDIDTRASTCSIAFEDPVKLDFGRVESAAADANYELTGIRLHIAGKVVEGDCDTCGKDRRYLKLKGTKQRLELAAQLPLGALEFTGMVTDWNSEHPRLTKD